MAGRRTQTLFVIDSVLAVALLLAAATALAFLVPYSTIDFSTSSTTPTFLGIEYGIWRTMHLYAGIAMIVGGAVHFAMHWSWMARAVRGLLPHSGGGKRAAAARVVSARPVGQSGGPTDG